MILKRAASNLLLLVLTGLFIYEAAQWCVIRYHMWEADRAAASVRLPAEKGLPWPASVPILNKSSGQARSGALVVALSSDCKTCIDNVAEYRELVAQAHGHFGLLILLNRGARNSTFLKQLGVRPTDVTELDLNRAGVKVTPTEWAVAADGLVSEVRLGQLMPVEDAYLAAVASGSVQPSEARVPDVPYDLSPQAIDTLKQDGMPIQLIDPQSRPRFHLNHRSWALNIPLDEIGTRIRSELDAKLFTVVDCTNVDRRICDATAKMFGSRGWPWVSVLGRAERTTAGCATNPFRY
jgi:hypothetical protein